MSEGTPNAWQLGFSDGQAGRPIWRQVLRDEYLDEYDRGYTTGRSVRNVGRFVKLAKEKGWA